MTLDFNQYVNRLFDLSVHRKFREIGLFLLKHSASEEEDIEQVQTKAVESLSGMFRQSSDNIYTLKDGLTGVHQQVNRNLSGQTSLTGTPTGFDQFDRRSGGLQKSDLIIIAAEQSRVNIPVNVYFAVCGTFRYKEHNLFNGNEKRANCVPFGFY